MGTSVTIVAGAALANGLAFGFGALIFLVLWWRGSLRLGPGPPGAPMGGEPLPMRLDGRFLVRGDRIDARTVTP